MCRNKESMGSRRSRIHSALLHIFACCCSVIHNCLPSHQPMDFCACSAWSSSIRFCVLGSGSRNCHLVSSKALADQHIPSLTFGLRSPLCDVFSRSISNKYLRVHSLHSVEQNVEWLYSFDIHCNAFFPLFLILYVVQYFLLPVLLTDGFLPLLLSNSLYAIAFCYYHYITFLGYSGKVVCFAFSISSGLIMQSFDSTSVPSGRCIFPVSVCFSDCCVRVIATFRSELHNICSRVLFWLTTSS